LDYYDLDNIPTSNSQAYKTRLKNPNGKLPAGLQ
jgi:hypothetical protein